MTKKIAVIDGNSLMHRAYHAVPPTMNAPDGTPTNAVFGFLAMLLKFIDMAKPDALVCAFDAGKPAFRMEALEQYKAQRPPMDDELRVQFPIMEELLGAMNVPVVKVKGWEGDDILGTIAARDEELGFETLLVTGDKDAYQLASGATRIVTTKKGVTDIAIYGPDQVEERYGVTPAQFPDFLGLMGDSSDNIPGVPGIGAKGAAKLLQRFGTMEGIYEHLSELKGKQLENLRDNEDAAFLSRDIATIVRDLDFALDLEDAAFPSFSAEAVEEAFGRYQLTSHLARVLKLVGAEATRAEARLVWEPVVAGEAAGPLVADALRAGETVGVALMEPEQVSLFDNAVTGAFATSRGTAVLAGDEALALFAQVVREGSFAVLDAKEAVHRVFPADTSLPALVTADDLAAMDAFDLGLAGYVLNSSVSAYTLEALMEAHGGGALPEAEGDEARAAVAAAAARHLVEPLRAAMEREGSLKAYRDIDLPLVGVLATMERTGAAIDVERLAEMGRAAQAELDELSQRIFELAGEPFNIDSPKQLARILFEVLGLTPLKKNQRGYSTDASVLKELAKESELPALVLRYREQAKLKSTYLDALPRMRAGDGRVHTRFNETVTTTGRLSSSDPNLQNIPVRTELGRRIRACFVPLEPGELFLSADYSQIELRLLAHLSGDEHLVAAFNSGADFHASTAARVFGLPVEEVTPELRSRAKAVNFGIVYGQQAYGLSQSLDIPFGEAKEMIDRYFEAYPGVRSYLDDTVARAAEDGFAETMFGRKRHIPELKARNAQQRGFGERTAMNHPMQGSAADIIKMAMNEVDRRLREEGLAAKLMIQVHDELDFSVPEGEVERLAALVREVMENVVSLAVPLDVDVSWGPTWAEAH
ncbi:DNA polymerase I [Adlercreutzia faecimuris]|uniref:DNA polymerase I n=1 Tax=Adlercreutzia faecimuris TaxID=2897341 RepID=A0ABS9WI73_9ACTN|nr:DNA polymerase I [Adlercreutzia sp. JBNU-10]MCI2242569.1 DNA polymerase I [Adlercreutzia sp. JBNU-10]